MMVANIFLMFGASFLIHYFFRKICLLHVRYIYFDGSSTCGESEREKKNEAQKGKHVDFYNIREAFKILQFYILD